MSWRDNYFPGELEELGMEDWSPLESPVFDNSCPECHAGVKEFCVGLSDEALVHRPRAELYWETFPS